MDGVAPTPFPRWIWRGGGKEAAGEEEGEGRGGGEEQEPSPRGRALLVLGAGGRGRGARAEPSRQSPPRADLLVLSAGGRDGCGSRAVVEGHRAEGGEEEEGSRGRRMIPGRKREKRGVYGNRTHDGWTGSAEEAVERGLGVWASTRGQAWVAWLLDRVEIAVSRRSS